MSLNEQTTLQPPSFHHTGGFPSPGHTLFRAPNPQSSGLMESFQGGKYVGSHLASTIRWCHWCVCGHSATGLDCSGLYCGEPPSSMVLIHTHKHLAASTASLEWRVSLLVAKGHAILNRPENNKSLRTKVHMSQVQRDVLAEKPYRPPKSMPELFISNWENLKTSKIIWCLTIMYLGLLTNSLDLTKYSV